MKTVAPPAKTVPAFTAERVPPRFISSYFFKGSTAATLGMGGPWLVRRPNGRILTFGSSERCREIAAHLNGRMAEHLDEATEALRKHGVNDRDA